MSDEYPDTPEKLQDFADDLGRTISKAQSELAAPPLLGAGVELASALDPMEGKRCISCGKLMPKKYWHLPKDDVNGCGLRPLCHECA
jgi:hypothetical protein